jgi:DNA-binding NarL/FixJ family response regulator
VLDTTSAAADERGARLLVDRLQSLARRAWLTAAASRVGTGATESDDGIERLGLIERERPVLALLATGMTNRQIEEELFISRR